MCAPEVANVFTSSLTLSVKITQRWAALLKQPGLCSTDHSEGASFNITKIARANRKIIINIYSFFENCFTSKLYVSLHTPQLPFSL